MNAANYEVNIQLNTGPIDSQLRTLERRVNALRRNLAAPLRAEQQALRTAERSANLADRRASTMVITRNLGEKLNRLEQRGVDVAKARAALDRAGVATDKGRLETARSLNKTVRDFINQQDRAGSVTRRTGRMATENINALFNAQRKRYSLDQKIRRLEESGVSTSKLRNKLGEFTEAQAQRNFGSVRKIGSELDLLIKKEQDRLRVQQNQTREQARQLSASQRAGGPASPLRGTVTMPGSPAALSAAARAGGARSSIRGSIDIPGSPAFIEAQARERVQALKKAASLGGARSSIRGDVNTPGSPAFIEAQNRELARSARLGGATSPIKGSAQIPGSPAFIAAQARERDTALKNAARIGGARSSIRGDVNTPGSPAFIEAQQKELERLARRGGATSPIRGSVNIPGSPAFIEAQARETRRALDRAATIGGARSPIGGTANIPGSPAFLAAQQRRNAAFAGRGRDALSNAIIGGAFPALFGQGAGAAVGGGLGGLAGGLAGGTFGFGLSLVGTAIGQAVDEANALSKELINVNTRLTDVGDSSRTTAKDIENLASNLNTTKDDALKLINSFKEFDSAKVREAVATSFGAAGGREAFDALSAINDSKSALEAIVKLRTELGNKVSVEALNQLKTNGALGASIFLQQRLAELQDARLVKQAQEIQNQDRIQAFLQLGILGSLDLANFEKTAQASANKRADSVKKEAENRRKLSKQALEDTKKFFAEVAKLNAKYTAEGRTTKPPESRAASLQEELTAIKEIGVQENRIRDLRFENRETAAIRAEYAKQVADITRDQNKQLLQANYAEEKSPIIAIAQQRIANAREEREDRIREIEKRRADAHRDIIRSVTDESDLIRARMSGREREVTITQKLRDYEEQKLGFGKKGAAEYRQQLELLYQLQDAEELFQLEQQKRFTGAGMGAGFIGDAARAYENALISGQAEQHAMAVARLTEQLSILQMQSQATEQVIMGIGEAFGNSMTVGVQQLIGGTKNAQEVFADFLNQIANLLLQTAAQMIATYTAIGIARMFAGVPGANPVGQLNASVNQYQSAGITIADFAGARAAGGPVSAGSSYLVGEKGPELFMPGTSGKIIPNDALGGMGGGSVVVNVDAKGSTVEGNSNQASQLGKVIGAAVQQELIKQKKPGGLLA